MVGYLGTLFTGKIALNLALPSRNEFSQATTLFGKGLESIFQLGGERLKHQLQNQEGTLQHAFDESQSLQSRYLKEGSDAVEADLKLSNKRMADLLGADVDKMYADGRRTALSINRLLSEAVQTQLEPGDEAAGIAEDVDKAVAQLTANVENFAKHSVQHFANGLREMTMALLSFYYMLNQVIDSFRVFEEELINAQSIFQTSFEELFEVSDQLVDFTLKYGIEVNQTSKVLYQLASAGLTAAESNAVLTDVLKLSMAVQGDANTLGKLTIQTIKGFGLEMEDSAVLTDKFAYAINKSLIEWQDLASSIKFAMPFFSATGQSVDQLLGSIEILTNRALEAGIAGRGLRQALAEFAEGAEDNTTKMAQLGVVTTDEAGNLLQLTEIAKNFADTMGAEVSNNTELLTTLLEDLNVRGATAFVHLVQNADEFQAAVDDLANAAGSATEMAEIQQRSLNREIQLVKNALLAPFLLSDAAYTSEGYLNEFHATLHSVVEEMHDLFFVTVNGQEVLSDLGFQLREMATDLLINFRDLIFQIVDIFKKFNEQGLFNIDLLKLYFYPLSLVVGLLEVVPNWLGEAILGLYVMNKFLPLTTMLSWLWSDSVWAAAQALYAANGGLGMMGTMLGGLLAGFLVIGAVFRWFGDGVGIIATALLVLAAAAAVAWAALNPASAAANMTAIALTAAAVGGVGAAIMSMMPTGGGASFNLEGGGGDYDTYLASVGGTTPVTAGGGGGGQASAQTLIVDRANFRSDNLSDTDYDSMIRT